MTFIGTTGSTPYAISAEQLRKRFETRADHTAYTLQYQPDQFFPDDNYRIGDSALFNPQSRFTPEWEAVVEKALKEDNPTAYRQKTINAGHLSDYLELEAGKGITEALGLPKKQGYNNIGSQIWESPRNLVALKTLYGEPHQIGSIGPFPEGLSQIRVHGNHNGEVKKATKAAMDALVEKGIHPTMATMEALAQEGIHPKKYPSCPLPNAAQALEILEKAAKQGLNAIV